MYSEQKVESNRVKEGNKGPFLFFETIIFVFMSFKISIEFCLVFLKDCTFL